ncbi:MAG: NAD(P)-dependent oxidoreductase [Acetobacterales bacterium]
MTARSVLVTGSSGLIGALLVRDLAAAGCKVVGLDPAPYPFGDVPMRPVAGDVRDRAFLAALFEEHGFDGVVHAGGASGPTVMADRPGELVEVNVFGTAHLLALALEHRVRRFVYLSSASAYGDMPRAWMDEDAPFRPAQVYGATKAASDALVRAYRVQHGLDAIALRIGTVYGPRRGTNCLVRDMLEAALAGRSLRLTDAGRLRQYIYADDAALAVRRALDVTEVPQHAYNVSGPDALPLTDVAAIVRETVAGADVTVVEGDDPQWTFRREPLDCSAAGRDLGYVPEWPLRRGIAAYADWLREK